MKKVFSEDQVFKNVIIERQYWMPGGKTRFVLIRSNIYPNPVIGPQHSSVAAAKKWLKANEGKLFFL